jgi:hypothetical protein
LPDAERAERRRADRAFACQAVEELRSSEGWQQWLTSRRHFHPYSLIIWSRCMSSALGLGHARWRHVVGG